jgi:hypothetical protein
LPSCRLRSVHASLLRLPHTSRVPPPKQPLPFDSTRWQSSCESIPRDSNRSPPPSGLPCSTRSTLSPARLSRLPKQPRPRTGSKSVASAARDLSPLLERLEIHTETRVHALVATRWLAHSAGAIPHRSSGEEREVGPLRAEALQGPDHRSDPARVVPSHRRGGLASGSMPSGIA